VNCHYLGRNEEYIKVYSFAIADVRDYSNVEQMRFEAVLYLTSNVNYNVHNLHYFTVTDVSYCRWSIGTCAAVASTSRMTTTAKGNTKTPQGVIRFVLLVTTPVNCWVFLLVVPVDCLYLVKFCDSV
jgi:hypothetical protein